MKKPTGTVQVRSYTVPVEAGGRRCTKTVFAGSAAEAGRQILAWYAAKGVVATVLKGK